MVVFLILLYVNINVPTTLSNKLYIKTVIDELTQPLLTINVNASSSVVEYGYRESDDSLKSWTTVYKKDLQIFRSIVFGEVETEEPIVMFACFLMHLDVTEIASLKVIQNLKQPQYANVQHADYNLTEVTKIFNQVIAKEELKYLGEEVFHACRDANTIYMSSDDFTKLSDEMKSEVTLTTLKSNINLQSFPFCNNLPRDWKQGCFCSTNINIKWYPCDGRVCYVDENGPSNVCGLKTCERKHKFVYLVENLFLCLER